MDRRCRLAVGCKLIRNYVEGKGKQPWVIYSRTDDGEVLERKERLECAGARMIESDHNGKWPRPRQRLGTWAEEFSQRCLECCTRYTRWVSGL